MLDAFSIEPKLDATVPRMHIASPWRHSAQPTLTRRRRPSSTPVRRLSNFSLTCRMLSPLNCPAVYGHFDVVGIGIAARDRADEAQISKGDR